MRTSALIVAGGKGLRMRMDVRKQYLQLGDFPVVGHTLRVFDLCPAITDICLVVPRSDLETCRHTIVEPLFLDKTVLLTAGGEERQHSVCNGLKALGLEAHDLVVIHDGVRPFVTNSQIVECVSAARATGSAILAVPVSDTLKLADGEGMVDRTLDRHRIWAAQTPQVFRYDLIREAHDRAVTENVLGTDDAFLVERLGGKVAIVQGSRNNIKITTPEDLEIARSLLETNFHGKEPK